MGSIWTKEKAWEWYDGRPWLRGCNFMGSDCANRIDQWQKLGFEERLKTADGELALAAETGFNTIRIILEFIVWDREHDGFMERFDRYLETAHRHGISCMVVLGNDCMPPKDEFYRPPEAGRPALRLGLPRRQKAFPAFRLCRHGVSSAGRSKAGAAPLRVGPRDHRDA